MSLAEKLQVIRKKKGMTYQNLVILTGLSPSTIEKVFQGKQINPRLDTVKKLKIALDLNLDELLNDN